MMIRFLLSLWWLWLIIGALLILEYKREEGLNGPRQRQSVPHLVERKRV
jgi:hypothetical protein